MVSDYKEEKQGEGEGQMVPTALVIAKPLSIIVPRHDLQKFHQALLDEARENLRVLLPHLSGAKQALDDAQAVVLTTAEDLAERVGLPEQARHYIRSRSRRIGQLRKRITELTRQVSVARRTFDALDAGFIPMPRMPAVKLEYAMGLIPIEALECLAEAKDTGLFDEFRIVDGRDVSAYGYPAVKQNASTAALSR